MSSNRLKQTGIFICQLLYFVSRILAVLLQRLIHFFNGTGAHRQKVRQGMDTTGNIAEVSHVIARIPGIGMSSASYSHFLCWHEQFAEINYLRRPNVTLYFIDLENAVFVETPPEINIYDTKRFPFFFIAQRLVCTKLITVPLKDFVKLSKQLGAPECDVGWIFHTTRCGSTAVVQGLNAVPDCTVISEVQDLMVHLAAVGVDPNVNFAKYLNSEAFKDILSASINFMFKDFAENQLACYKTTGSFNYLLIDTIATLYPSHKLVSMHRDGPGTAKSFWRMASDHTGVTVGLYAINTLPFFITASLRKTLFWFTNGLLEEVETYVYSGEYNLFIFMYLQWLTNIVAFQRNKEKLRGKLLPIYHDDFQANKPEVMLKIFDLFGISGEHLQVAIKGMEGDSQAGTPLDLKLMQSKQSWTRDERTVAICNKVLEQFSLPSFDQKFRFNSNLEIEII